MFCSTHFPLIHFLFNVSNGPVTLVYISEVISYVLFNELKYIALSSILADLEI